MKPIDAASFNKALSILSQTFQENPSVLSVVKKDDKESQRIAALCKYCIRISIEKQGAFISSCEKGVALAYDSRKKISAWKSLLNYIRLGQYCIGWDRAFTIIRRDIEIHRRRGNEPHLYFWMLAVGQSSPSKWVQFQRFFQLFFKQTHKAPVSGQIYLCL